MLVAVAHDDAYVLGVLSSRVHVVWALALGGRLGVGNDPRYNKTRCFETFPFPDADDAQQEEIRALAERLDAFRKARLAEHPALTLTGLYNVLEDVRAGRELNAKGRAVFEQGLVGTLSSLQGDLDAAVAAAYGYAPDLAAQELLGRLAALNARRAAEEKAGIVRYLRPAYQDPKAAQQRGLGMALPEGLAAADAPPPFPERLPEQARAVQELLQRSARPLSAADVAARFEGARRERVEELLELFASLGQVRQAGGDDGAGEVTFAA